MPTEKAAMFIDNSNIFKGMQSFRCYLYKKGILQDGQFLRMRWDKLLSMLEDQDGGLDIYARHFFASLPPAADVSRLRKRPSEDQWQKLVKKSAQTGFYKKIQDQPYNFTLHGVPLRFTEIYCRDRMKQAYQKCESSQGGQFTCNLSVDLDECNRCSRKFLFKYEKGVDVALAAQLVIFGGIRSSNLNRIILVAGDGDYREAIRFVRQEVGRDIQIVSWRRALSRDLEKLSNKSTIILDDHWKTVCGIKKRIPLDEVPADYDEAASEED